MVALAEVITPGVVQAVADRGLREKPVETLALR
jgi:hypothetical protein